MYAHWMTLADDDNIIPVYGFGDAKTNDTSVFSFGRDAVDQGFPLESIRQRYRELVPQIRLAGPTSFAPIIHEAINIVRKTKQFHILLIIADGQVTRPSDTSPRELSKNENETVNAIRLASQFPLSIVMVGVGDGPWDLMNTFDDYVKYRAFDNFQFVEYSVGVSLHAFLCEALALTAWFCRKWCRVVGVAQSSSRDSRVTRSWRCRCSTAR
ncbi:hypothetical protein PINS_up010163 [Pythium insidiosum]|nr:hypothetical protein PINS_up010163 [Pythium insidiosum]